MKSPEEIHQELRHRILNLSGVTERQNAGIHEDAFFVGRTMFMHIHPESFRGCEIHIRFPKSYQERVLAQGKAHPHRWAPEAGYVTFLVDDAKDLEPAMELIRMSHQHFGAKPNVLRAEHELK
jgi:hypothetical protein